MGFQLVSTLMTLNDLESVMMSDTRYLVLYVIDCKSRFSWALRLAQWLLSLCWWQNHKMIWPVPHQFIHMWFE